MLVQLLQGLSALRLRVPVIPVRRISPVLELPTAVESVPLFVQLLNSIKGVCPDKSLALPTTPDIYILCFWVLLSNEMLPLFTR